MFLYLKQSAIRFFWRVDPDGDIVNGNHVDASPEGRLGIPENAKRNAIEFGYLCMAGQRDIDGVRNPGGGGRDVLAPK